MAAGEREWDERPSAAPSEPVAPAEDSKSLGCGLWALILLAVPAAGVVLWLGGMFIVAIFG